MAVGIKGRHFDPNIFSLRTDALSSTAAAVDGKAATLRPGTAAEDGAPSSHTAPPTPSPKAKIAQESAPASEGEEGSVPAAPVKGDPLVIAVGGLKPMSDTEFYSSDTLFQKIDGRAPAYQGFNVQQLRSRSFEIEGSGGSFIDVYEYKMDTPTNAFGIFALERDPHGKEIDFAKDGYSGELGFYFRQGAVYEQIIASDQKPRTIELAKAVALDRAKALPIDDGGLDARRRLPSAGLIPESVTFIQEDAQGQDFLKNVFQASYNFEGKKVSFFIMATSPEAATNGWKSYLAFCGRFGGKAAEMPPLGNAKVFKAENFGTSKVIFQRGGEIGGVVDSTDESTAERFVEQFLQGLLK